MTKSKDEFIYYITIADIQDVAEKELERELTAEEIKLVADRVGEYIAWYDAIALTIGELIPKNNDGHDESQIKS
jgi:hypothetical protein